MPAAQLRVEHLDSDSLIILRLLFVHISVAKIAAHGESNPNFPIPRTWLRANSWHNTRHQTENKKIKRKKKKRNKIGWITNWTELTHSRLSNSQLLLLSTIISSVVYLHRLINCQWIKFIHRLKIKTRIYTYIMKNKWECNAFPRGANSWGSCQTVPPFVSCPDPPLPIYVIR